MGQKMVKRGLFSLPQRFHFANFVLEVRHVGLEHVEPGVDHLDPIPLPGVPPCHGGGLHLLD